MIDAPRLMLVTDRRRTTRPLPALVEAAVRGGVDAVQLREPDLAPADRRDLARALIDAIAGRARLVINSDAALAADLGVGLHLPEQGVPAVEARRLVDSQAMLGRSVHSPESAAASDGVDYLIAGHVFATSSKPDRPPIGLDGFGRIIAAAAAPVLAIGGITADRAASTIAAGARGVAVIGAIAGAPDPEAAAHQLRAAVETALEQMMTDEPTTESTAATIHVVVNGKPVELAPATTIADFLSSRGLTSGMAIVELNGVIVPRGDYLTTVFAAGDQVEVVHAVGGG
jgi:thiamine-phosphate pyrophosphorylase